MCFEVVKLCRNIKALHKEGFESRREAGGFIVSND